MSNSSNGQPQSQANSPQASSQALLDELRLAADRARDERLKLARLFKHTSDLPVNTTAAEGVPAVADSRVIDLSQQVERLEQIVAEKLIALEQTEAKIESRTQYLESLRHTITETTSAFTTQVEEAQHFKAHIDAAKKHVRMSAGKVADEVRQTLSACESPIAERLNQLKEMDKQIDQRIARMQQMHKQANEAVDKHLLGALRSAKEQAAELAAPVKAEVDKHLQAQSSQIDQAIQAKIAELDVDVEQALQPVTDRFNQIILDANAQADDLAEVLPARIEKLLQEQLDELREAVVRKTEDIVLGIDEKTLEEAEKRIRERAAGALDEYLGKAERDAGGYVDGLITKLDEARGQALEKFEQSLETTAADKTAKHEQVLVKLGEQIDQLQDQAGKRFENLQAGHEQAVEQFAQQIDELNAKMQEGIDSAHADHGQSLQKLNDELDRLKQQAQERVDAAHKVIEETADNIHRRATAAVDAAIEASDQRLDEYQTVALQSLQAIDDGLEDGMEQTRKRVTEFGKSARKYEDNAMRMAESAIAAAQKRIAGFESGITERVSIATKAVDETADSIGTRLDKLEQDAAIRVNRIVELAESSGKAVADSIDALAQKAEQTSARAQEDLEAKLEAFEEISAEALKTAEQTLRTNIGELRDASRAMIEIVTKQVKAQASHIEPETREVITQAEQTLRRRIAELREGAQSMVDLTVNRLESQIDEVKRKAQHVAFQGIQPEQDQQSAPGEAA